MKPAKQSLKQQNKLSKQMNYICSKVRKKQKCTNKESNTHHCAIHIHLLHNFEMYNRCRLKVQLQEKLSNDFEKSMSTVDKKAHEYFGRCCPPKKISGLVRSKIGNKKYVFGVHN